MLSLREAKELTAQIGQALDDLMVLTKRAYEGEADKVLGYESWESYVIENFPTLPRFDKAERQALARDLARPSGQGLRGATREEGMTRREVGATLGVSHVQVIRDLRGTNVPRYVEDPLGNRVQMPTDKRLVEAVEMAKDGMSFREIGPAVGLDESTVRREPAVRAVKGFAVHTSGRNLDSCGVLPETALARIKEIRQEGEYVLNLVDATLNRDYDLSPADRDDLLEAIKEISNEMIGYITEMETPTP